MRQPAFCTCKNKDADQLRGNREADERLCFRYTDSINDPSDVVLGCFALLFLKIINTMECDFWHDLLTDQSFSKPTFLELFTGTFFSKYMTVTTVFLNQ